MALVELPPRENAIYSCVQSLPHLAWVSNAEGKFVFVNQLWLETTGLPFDRSLGDGWREAIHPADQTYFLEKVRESLRHGCPLRCEVRLRIAEQTYARFEARAMSSAADPEHWIGTFTELESKGVAHHFGKNEQALEILSKTGVVLTETLDDETVLKALAILVLDSMADLCMIDLLNEKQEFERVISMHHDLKKDRLAEALKKYPPPFHEGELAFDSLAKGKGQLVRNDALVTLARQSGSEEYEHLLREAGCCSIIIVPLNSHDSLYGTLTLIRGDATFGYEESDLPLAEEVARRAALAIENARLYQRAQRANEAKTQFLANVSHEIRTPLGAILGFTELLLENEQSGDACRTGLDRDERVKYLDVIHRNGEQLKELIGDLLDLAKVEAGRLELEASDFSLRGLLDEATALLSLKAAEKGIQFEIDWHNDLPDALRGDRLKIKQVLINIIGNAVKFSSGGAIEIRAFPGTACLRGKPACIAIEVEDHGIGIAPENQSKLFQPFSQADNTMTRRFGGTGLGLLLAKRLAQALDGDVELLSSIVDKGSTFRISFATELAAQALSGISRPADSEATLNSHATAPLISADSDHEGKILVVDDSPDNQVLVSRFLKKANLNIEFASDGAEGIALGSKNNYDLILMDLQMPNVDGYTAITELRKRSIQTPIIALTAHALSEDRDRCFSVGCNDYLLKPIDAKRLREVVAHHLSARGHS